VEEDHAILRELLEGSPWQIRESHSLRSAVMLLEEHRIPLLMCERDLHPGSWEELLGQVTDFPNPPCVIVVSRQADEDLWVKALSAGAYDVLAKPFNLSELRRTLSDAWQCWHDTFELETAPKVMGAGA
jgi:DNA-binding NtrC family response regulator